MRVKAEVVGASGGQRPLRKSAESCWWFQLMKTGDNWDRSIIYQCMTSLNAAEPIDIHIPEHWMTLSKQNNVAARPGMHVR